jgi:uncharacterized protein YecT (DUF1311 family)
MAPLTVFAQTQREMTMQACQSYEKADAELNSTYRVALASYSKDTLFREKFKTAQRLWLKFRDAQIASRFALDTNENPGVVYGSMYPMLVCGYKEDLTRARTREIQEWIKAMAPDSTTFIRTGGERY